MEKESHSSSDSSDASGSPKSELGILPILIISLFVGLIAGAGVDNKLHILPVAFVVAVVLFINRKKLLLKIRRRYRVTIFRLLRVQQRVIISGRNLASLLFT